MTVRNAIVTTATVTTAMVAGSRYLDVAGAATYLGRTEHAIRHLVRQQAIPYIKKAGRVQFDRERLDRWMQAGARRVSA